MTEHEAIQLTKLANTLISMQIAITLREHVHTNGVRAQYARLANRWLEKQEHSWLIDLLNSKIKRIVSWKTW